MTVCVVCRANLRGPTHPARPPPSPSSACRGADAAPGHARCTSRWAVHPTPAAAELAGGALPSLDSPAQLACGRRWRKGGGHVGSLCVGLVCGCGWRGGFWACWAGHLAPIATTAATLSSPGASAANVGAVVIPISNPAPVPHANALAGSCCIGSVRVPIALSNAAIVIRFAARLPSTTAAPSGVRRRGGSRVTAHGTFHGSC